jgi:putative endopeptidase
MKTRTRTPFGFNLKDLNRGIRPQDDFYRYANGGWLKRSKIPPAESRWGSFIILRHRTDTQLRNILRDLTAQKTSRHGSPEQLVRDLYRSGMDMKWRNALKAKPLETYRKRIAAIASTRDLMQVMGELERVGGGAPWSLFVDQDSKNSRRYALHFFQGGLGMPEREYYLKDEPEFKRVRDAYRAHVARVYELLKETHVQAKVETIMRFETALARCSMNKVDARDAEKTYHKMTLKELAHITSGIDWNTYGASAHIPKVPYVIAGQPEFMRGVSELARTLPLDDWKIYLDWSLVNGSLSLLSLPFVEASSWSRKWSALGGAGKNLRGAPFSAGGQTKNGYAR